jgi:hypothetical protein
MLAAGGRTRPAARVALTLACVAALCGVATAATALDQVSKRTQVGPGELAGVRVVCPQGKAAVANGFSTTVENGALVVPEVTTIFSARRTHVTVENLGTAAGSATGWVYCSKLSPSQLTSKSDQVSLAGGEHGSAVARCPDGKAVAGAFNTKPDAPVYVSELRRAGQKSWRITGTNMQNGGVRLEVQVICQQRRSAPIERSSKVDSGKPLAFADARCRAGELLLSGGFRATSADPGFAFDSSRDGKRAWGVASFADGARVTAKSYAYCVAR